MVCRADVLLDDGTVAVVKTADAPAAAELRREGERLVTARHPGVVEVLRSSGDDEHWALYLRHSGRPATLLRAASPEQIAAIAWSAASTLADLHQRGVVHGRLAARHLLVGPEGAVRLCGFGADQGASLPTDDVAALGAVLVELLGSGEPIEPLPDGRWQRRRPWPGVPRRSLLAVADLACTEPASRRPTARRLAAIIAEAVPAVRDQTPSRAGARAGVGRAGRAATAGVPRRRHPATSSPIERPTPRHRSTAAPAPARRWAPVMAAAVGVVLLVVASSRFSAGGPRSPVGPGASGSGAVPCAVIGPEAPCQPIAIDGTSVEVGTTRFEVGQPGDQVITVDWDCDGNPTPAVLRPGTGEVFRFPTWVTEGPLEVTAIAVVPGAEALRPPPSSCGPPLVERTDGTSVPLALPGGPTA